MPPPKIFGSAYVRPPQILGSSGPHGCNATSQIASIYEFYFKSMAIAGQGIEPISGGATAQEQPSLRYQSPSLCSGVYMCRTEQRALDCMINAADGAIPPAHFSQVCYIGHTNS